jgi:hypothetical protein
MASVSNSAAAAKDNDASAWKTIKQRLEMLVQRVDAGGGNNESKSLRREEMRYCVECVCVLASGYEGGYCKARDTNC